MSVRYAAAALVAAAAVGVTGVSAQAADKVLASRWGETSRPAAVKGDLIAYWLAVGGGRTRVADVNVEPIIVNRYTVVNPVLVEIAHGRRVYRSYGKRVRQQLPLSAAAPVAVVTGTWADGQKVVVRLPTYR